jgi:hypothetical protein
LSARCSGARFPNQNSATRCRCMGDSVRGVLTGGGEAETPGHDAMRSRGGEVLPARNSLRSGCSLCPRDLHTVPGCPTEVHRSHAKHWRWRMPTPTEAALTSPRTAARRGENKREELEGGRCGADRPLSPVPVDPRARIPRGGCEGGSTAMAEEAVCSATISWATR